MADFKCVVCKHHYTPSDSPPCDNCEYIGDGRYSAYSPCTNADRIRSMTDEDLARWINFHTVCEECPASKKCNCAYTARPDECTKSILQWLKQEAVDNGACFNGETSEKVQEKE